MNWIEFFKFDWIKILLVFFLMFLFFLSEIILTSVTIPSDLPSIDDFRMTYNYAKEENKCNGLCEEFLENTSNLTKAVLYCQQKIAIDIDGTFKKNEKGHYNFVGDMPYCEDGLYCFHIYDCKFDNEVLDARTCLNIMCQYYEDFGLDENTALAKIKNKISYGTCEKDPRKWIKHPIDFPHTSYLADWWYVSSGYESQSCQKITYSIPVSVNLTELENEKQRKKIFDNLYNLIRLISYFLFIVLMTPTMLILDLLDIFSIPGIFSISIIVLSIVFYWYFLSCLIIWIYYKVKRKV